MPRLSNHVGRAAAMLAVSLAPLAASAAPLPSHQFADVRPLTDVQREGAIFHARVCDAPTQRGFARCHARIVTDATGAPIRDDTARIVIDAAGVTHTVNPRGLDPASLQSAYKVDPNAGSPTTIVAVVDAYGYPNAEADLAVYRAQYGLPPCTTANGCLRIYNQQGSKTGLPAYNYGWANETALDLDMVSAMCPKCTIMLVEANTASNADLAASVNKAATLGAHVISNSYGSSESGTQSIEPAYNHPGVAVTVSTGDSGYGVEFPASSPHVVATGGTALVRASGTARGWSETAWRGGGSGCSAVYPKPSWQADPNCTHRMVADVSAVSSPVTAVAVYGPTTRGGSAWHTLAGTSVAAPLIGGIYGANGGAVAAGGVYANPTRLFDVVSGSNGTCAVSYFCNARVGYDGPTGLGTPNSAAAF